MNNGQELRAATVAVRLHHQKFGVRKSLTPKQREDAADVFHAEKDSLSASKKLLDTKHEAFRKVVGVRSAATEYWKTNTIVYPEPGVRLMKREKVAEFDTQLRMFQIELKQAVENLEAVYVDLRALAKAKLGDLYNLSDYPATLSDEFGLDWDYPSIEPPSYLKDVHPELYEQEQQRIAARFEEAIRLTEEAMTAELSELVGHLCDQLTGAGGDGKPKVIRESALNNVQEFFAKFSTVGIRSNVQLEELAKKARDLVNGVDTKDLRKDGSMRADIAAKMAEVRAKVDGMVVVRKRAIMLEDEVESPVNQAPETSPQAQQGEAA